MSLCQCVVALLLRREWFFLIPFSYFSLLCQCLAVKSLAVDRNTCHGARDLPLVPSVQSTAGKDQADIIGVIIPGVTGPSLGSGIIRIRILQQLLSVGCTDYQ